MKTNKILLTLCALFTMTLPLNAQDMFYYYNGEKVNLTLDRNTVNIITDDVVMSSTIMQSMEVAYTDSAYSPTFTKVKFAAPLTTSQYSDIVNVLKQNSHIKKVCPFF
jgi:hypothetical protein